MSTIATDGAGGWWVGGWECSELKPALWHGPRGRGVQPGEASARRRRSGPTAHVSDRGQGGKGRGNGSMRVRTLAVVLVTAHDNSRLPAVCV
jgi:hypothetical protein